MAERRPPGLTRRRFTAAAAATIASIAVVRSPARAAQFSYKYGTDQSLESPLCSRAVEMWHAVERETGGRLSVKMFPNSILGGDSQMFSQIRSGALELVTLTGGLMAGVVPNASLPEVAFAFADPQRAFAAIDGDVGAYVIKECAAKDLVVLPHPWDNGFRQITANKPVRTAADLDGLKIRVPAAPMYLDLFKSLGAAPTPINVSELYTALQTHVVDAQENALLNIEQSNIYQVQKTLNFSNHSWSVWWFVFNADAWKALPPDVQAVVTRNVAKYGLLQRRDFAARTASLTDRLHRQGMTVYACDVASLKARLTAYYARWKATFGPAAWATLEKYTGSLA